MSGIKPSELVVAEKRNPTRKGEYNPSSYFRIKDRKLQQMWWSDAGDAVWESISNCTDLKDIARGEK